MDKKPDGGTDLTGRLVGLESLIAATSTEVVKSGVTGTDSFYRKTTKIMTVGFEGNSTEPNVQKPAMVVGLCQHRHGAENRPFTPPPHENITFPAEIGSRNRTVAPTHCK